MSAPLVRYVCSYLSPYEDETDHPAWVQKLEQWTRIVVERVLQCYCVFVLCPRSNCQLLYDGETSVHHSSLAAALQTFFPAGLQAPRVGTSAFLEVSTLITLYALYLPRHVNLHIHQHLRSLSTAIGRALETTLIRLTELYLLEEDADEPAFWREARADPVFADWFERLHIHELVPRVSMARGAAFAGGEPYSAHALQMLDSFLCARVRALAK